MNKQNIVICSHLPEDLKKAIASCAPDKIFILTDEHTHLQCVPVIKPIVGEAEEIVVGAEDMHKNLNTLSEVWQALSERGASRQSLLINLAGGMSTDLGGFAASRFKRGISYINIPTNLLAMVDESVGGK